MLGQLFTLENYILKGLSVLYDVCVMKPRANVVNCAGELWSL